MNSFRGLISKNILSDDAASLLSKRTEQFKKMGQLSSEIVTSVLKVYQIYLLQLPRIMSLLFQQSPTEKQSNYNNIKAVYLEIYKEYQNFILDYLQTPSNQITNSNSLKFINFSGCTITFQKQLKSYHSTENLLLDNAKKYFKLQKNLISSIDSYKLAFTQAKLVYNTDQKLKRYSICEQNYNNLSLELQNIKQLKQKLESKKKQIVACFQSLIFQEEANQIDIDLRTFTFLSKFNRNICQNFKKRIQICKSRGKSLQSKTFNVFDSIKLQQLLESTNLNDPESSKKLISLIQKHLQSIRLEHTQIYQFHLQFFKTAQKKCITQLKQVVTNFDKTQKRIQQFFSKQTYRELKNTVTIIKQTMQSYNQTQKRLVPKINAATESTEQLKAVIKSFVQMMQSNERQLPEVKDREKDKQRQVESGENSPKEKSSNLKSIVKLNQIKVNSITNSLINIYSDILSIFEASINNSYDQCSIIGYNSFYNFQENLKSIKNTKQQKLRNTMLSQLLSEEYKKGIVFEDQDEKTQEFKKLKKPGEIEIVQKQKQGVTPTKQQQQQINDELEQKLQGSMIKNKKKYLQFLQSRISFVQNEELLNTFSCALADKIILQGRLYVTNHRVCFYSKFNQKYVFFGETFIQIPKKDIITLQKRKNGIFFDNSISITTVKGEVFLTSFFRRNEAFALISGLLGIKLDNQAYQNDNEVFQSDSSQVAEKTPGKAGFDEIKEQEFSEKKEFQECEDDINQQQVNQRAQQIQKYMNQLTYGFKQCAFSQYKFQWVTALKLLQILHLQKEVTISQKKYMNFNEYFKKILQLHKDLEISPFTPQMSQFLNITNIKSSCPTKFTRKITSSVPTPNAGIPFVPKSTQAIENQTLYIISKNKWVLDNEVESRGAPYTDSFRVYYRTVCESKEGLCKIQTKLCIHFLKSVMVKGVIESKTNQQSKSQTKRLYDELGKYLSQLNKERISKQKSKIVKLGNCKLSENISNPEAQKSKQLENQNSQLQDKIKELEEKIESMCEENSKRISEEEKKLKLFKTLIISSVLLNFFLFLFLFF